MVWSYLDFEAIKSRRASELIKCKMRVFRVWEVESPGGRRDGCQLEELIHREGALIKHE